MTREEAIKRFETLLLHVDTGCVMGMETTEAINLAIKALAQPERKRGRWIAEDDGWTNVLWKCSQCGELYCLIDDTPKENGYHFCPNCGAQMLEAEGCHRGFTCHRGYKCMCFQCGEKDCERYQSEPPDLTDSLEDELFEQFEKAMKGAKDEQRRDCQVSPGDRV